MSRDQQANRVRARTRYLALTAGLGIAGLSGYVGTSILGTTGADTGTATVILAALTGMAAFFSPCSFPLLLTQLTRRAAESPRAAGLAALRVGLGAGVLLATLGGVIALGGGAMASFLAFGTTPGNTFRFLVGGLLIVFGLHQSGRLRLRRGWLEGVAAAASKRLDPLGSPNRARADVTYGFGYLLTGFG